MTRLLKELENIPDLPDRIIGRRRRKAQQLAAYVKAHMSDVEKVILFGRVLFGNQRLKSDTDIAVVLIGNGKPDKERIRVICRELKDHNFPLGDGPNLLHLQFYTQEYLKTERGGVLDAVRNGRVL